MAKTNIEYKMVVDKIWNMYYNNDKTIAEICKIVCGVTEADVKKMLGIKNQPQLVQQG